MNVLFIYASAIIPERGGVQRTTSVLADYLESNKIKVFYLSLDKYEPNTNISTRQFYFPCSDKFNQKAAFLKAFLHNNKIDIIINQHGISPSTSDIVFLAKESNVKIISVINNSILSGIENFSTLYKNIALRKNIAWLMPITNLKFVKYLLLLLYRRRYYKHYFDLCDKSNIVVQLSDKFRYELEFITKGKDLDNLISIPNPVSFSNESINLKNKKKEILYVGRIDTVNKRLDLLLAIWDKLYLKFPDWQLKIIGDGPELSDLIRLSKRKGLKRVCFEGFKDPRHYYKDSSIFCMTSAAESFGIVLLEAMQYGSVPFAFHSYPSVSDIIDHRQNGVLISPFNINEYADELGKLMSDTLRRENIAMAAYKKSNEFSIEKVGNRWINLFNTIIQTSGKNDLTFKD